MARTVVLDSFQVDVRLDQTKTNDPKSVTRLPQYYLFGLEKPVRIGRLQLTRSGITHSERKFDGTRFGTLSFDSVEAVISNLTNVRNQGSAARSIIDVRALLAGAGPLVAQFEYDFASPRLNLSYRGNVSRMDARAFNRMLVDVEGLRIRSGRLDSAWFQVDVNDDLATGSLRLRYRDFEIETLDKRTRERSLGDVFRTFFANTFKLHENNPSGDDRARTATLRLERAELPLFQFIWFTLRGGIFQIVGLKGDGGSG